MKVLFIGDLYCSGNIRMGLSEWETGLWSSLESTGVEVARFHPDKYFYHMNKRCDEALLRAISEINPDYIVCVYHFGTYSPTHGQFTVPEIATLLRVKIPIIFIWGDLENETQRKLARIMSPIAHKMIGTASKEVVEREGYTYMHVPKDSRIFNNPNKERDIDVLFNGSYKQNRPERLRIIEYLKTHGIKIVAGGSEGDEHFTTEEYADRYKRAKIALSFSQAGGVNVVNARPFEAILCGACLVEQKSPELEKLFMEGFEYASWINEDDLLQTIHFLLANNSERESIALAGQKHCERDYSAKTFWNILK